MTMDLQTSTNNLSEVKDLLERIPELNSCYNVLSKIGEGSFSKVYKATKKRLKTKELYALKCITSSTEPKRIAAELKYMLKVGGRNYVMSLTNCEIVRGNVILVMPYFQHSNFYEYVETLTFLEISNYMTALLTALEWVHKNGIIHRDVKPSNFLYDRLTDQYILVDFGLAQNVIPSKSSSCSIIVKSGSNNVPNDANSTKIKIETSKISRKTVNESNRIFKRNLDQALDSADLGSIPIAKKLCFDGDDIDIPETTFLQPLGTSNRINVTVLPPGSEGIKKPSTILHKKVLFKENAKGNKITIESSTLIVPEETATLPPTSISVSTVSVPRISRNSTRPSSCQCFGKKTVCSSCLSKPPEYAPRAGTPGFRPPEVLIKYPNQSPAVDIWAAGVIFISLLSRRYPFFTNSDDMMALAEIACILGLNRVKKAALRMGKVITLQTEYHSKDLHTLCQSLRDNLSTSYTTKAKKESIPSSAINLLYRLLDPDPVNRITASQALKHPFILKKCLVKSPRMKL